MSTEIGDVPESPNVAEVRQGLAALAQAHRDLADGKPQPLSPYEQRAALVKEREVEFHRRAEAELKRRHDEFRAPIVRQPLGGVPDEVVDE
jgi:hypothetical protein